MKKIIGYVGVDSGQVMICDPCYIDSQWKKEDFKDVRKYKHTDGTILQYRVDFENFESVIPKYNKTMNQINSDGEATVLPREKSEHNFSYNACCEKTLGEDGFGQLNYEMGHEGVGVVSSSGWGDGLYPVVANIDTDGRVKSLTIKFF